MKPKRPDQKPARRKSAASKSAGKKSARTTSARAPRYSERSFWSLARKSFSAIGEATLTQALILYHTLQDERTPQKARILILGALAYLILPTDLIPDFLPVVGFTDDAGAIAAAVAAVAANIKPEHKRKAAATVKELFARV